MQLPPAVLGPPGRADLRAPRDRRHPLHPRRAPHESTQPIPMYGGILEPLVRRQQVDPPVQRLDHRRRIHGQRRPQRRHELAVRIHRDPPVAGRDAAAHLGQHARRQLRVPRHPRGALPDRERLVQRGHRPLGRLPRAERAEIAGVVVAHLFDQRQPRKRFDGDLQPVLPFRELGPPVVPRLVLGDQPQLADLGLE